ncbi:hypothetical protein [[Micrococcus luteus] ATCC 49442]|uniref:hypothetical protein n=1 Tax=[Micrococcus luteus] ATCC 49442 TaxID=2698727 RepID=UPI001AD71428|nr:hypothetical protein [[Micrococcus luteus] ATCC 49442]
MITTVQAGSAWHVKGDNPRSIQEDLSSAVEIARQQAMKNGQHGILVTRLGPGSFTVALSTKVPYGTTQESCQMTSRQRRLGPEPKSMKADLEAVPGIPDPNEILDALLIRVEVAIQETAKAASGMPLIAIEADLAERLHIALPDARFSPEDIRAWSAQISS